MRKLISVLTIAALVLTLGATAFAAPDSPVAAPEDNASVTAPTVSGAVNAAGETVEVEVKAPEIPEGETLKSVTESAVKAAEEQGIDLGGANAAEVCDISLKGTDAQPDGSVRVTLFRESDSGEVMKIMYQREDGGWDEAQFTTNDDGTITIVFEHFCTVVFLVKDPEQAPDVKPTPKPDGGSTGGSGSSEPTSPQTGYDCA